MPIETLFISGPRLGGKTTVAHLLADEVLDRPLHYIRMRRAEDDHTNTVHVEGLEESLTPGSSWISTHTIVYTSDRVFETLPDGLRLVREIDRKGFVIIEADSDCALRHAYPYDYRLFVMPPPQNAQALFRDPRAAAAALQQVMQDTAAFASEIFGIFDGAGVDDSVGVHHQRPNIKHGGTQLEKLEVRESQVRHFLKSPLGAEIASRIQLQPEYYALIESDVAIINTGLGTIGEVLDECVKRLEKLLARVRHDARRQSVLYWGDIAHSRDPMNQKLIRRLKTLLAA
jgi:hypothetical protein